LGLEPIYRKLEATKPKGLGNWFPGNWGRIFWPKFGVPGKAWEFILIPFFRAFNILFFQARLILEGSYSRQELLVRN